MEDAPLSKTTVAKWAGFLLVELAVGSIFGPLSSLVLGLYLLLYGFGGSDHVTRALARINLTTTTALWLGLLPVCIVVWFDWQHSHSNTASVPSASPEINEVVARVFDPVPVDQSPVKVKAVLVKWILDNSTVPDSEIQNVSADVWAESKYLISQVMPPVWQRDQNRMRYHVWVPVLSKMSVYTLPALMFTLPPPGERTSFGAQIVSKSTDFKQYRWWLENEGGKGVVHGGDATPKTPELRK